MRSDRIYFRSIVTFTLAVLFFLTALVFVQLLKPSRVEAQQTQNNTAVFSGQVIPAFIGTAYDPSYAYQRLAGMPIYVFAYDSWGGSGFVINNLAVRTQIRVDGTFQAQGLPNAANYGVYFPFALEGSGIIRTDCTGSGAPCAIGSIGIGAAASIPFRVPQLENLDEIQDVFSYNLGDARGIAVQDQFGNEINLGLSFLTQETKVDVANNTNTFPVIPTSTIRINSKPINLFPAGPTSSAISDNFSDDAYEIVAQRVVGESQAGSVDIPTNVPFIRGRTTFPVIGSEFAGDQNQFLNDRTFQAFAPPGVYAITVWRAEGGISYRTYNSDQGISSSLVGFGVLRVRDSSNSSTLGDWTTISPLENYIPLRDNKFVVWGVIYDPSTGRVVSGSSAANLLVNLYNPQQEAGINPANPDPKVRRSDCPADGPWSSGTGSSCDQDPPTAPELVDESFGVYAIFDATENPILQAGLSQRKAHFAPYLTGSYGSIGEVNDSTFNSNIDEVFTTYGPVRQDMFVAAAPTSGLLGIVDLGSYPANNTEEITSPEAAEVSIVHSDTDEDYFADDPLVQNSPYKITDVLREGGTTQGQIYFPADNFLPGVSYDIKYMYPGAAPVYQRGVTVDPAGGLVQHDISFTQTLASTDQLRGNYNILGFIPAHWLQPDPPVALGQSSACDEGEAKFTMYFTGGTAYQSVEFEREGKAFKHLRESFLAQQSGDWSYVTCLPYTNPDTVCEAAGIGPTDEDRDACEIDAARQNTFAVTATADGADRGAHTVVRFKEVEGDALGPSANPPTANFEFEDTCSILNQDLKQKLEAEQAEAEEISFTSDPVGAIKAGFGKTIDGVTEVTFPTMGCKIGAGLTPIISNGFYSIRDQLILDPLTTVPAVISAWTAMRGIANFFFVFILLLIAINYILGVDRKTWNLGTLLPQLILGIILANTTLLITQALLDVNNILTAWLFSITFNILETSGISSHAIGTAAGLSGIAAIGSLIGSLISGGVAGALASAAASGGTAILPILGFVITIIGALAGFVITIIAMLFGRVLIIWLLVIAGPIFFALSTLPWTGNLKDLWWKSLIPVAFMQTIITALLSIGIILMSIPGEGDSVLARASIFLAGGVTLFSVLKSPQLAMQILGGGGLAGQAFGAVAGVASRVGGAASGLTQSAVGGLSPDAIKARQDRDEALKQLRPELFEGGRVGNFMRRVGAGGRNYQYAKYQEEQKLAKRQSEKDKIQEKAADHAIKMDKLDNQAFDQGTVRKRLPGFLAGRAPGSQRARMEQKSKMTKEQTNKLRVRLQMNKVPLEAWSAGANDVWATDENKTITVAGRDDVLDADGNVIEKGYEKGGKGVPVTRTFKQLIQEAAEDAGLTGDKLRDAINAGSFDNLTHPTRGIGADGIKVQEKLLKRLETSRLYNVSKGGADMSAQELYNEGMRRRSHYKSAEGIDFPAPSGGDDKK